MGTTVTGLPYPEPTDPVAAGADAIKALALALDSRPRGLLGKSLGPNTNSGFFVGVGPSQISGMVVSIVQVVGRWYRVRTSVNMSRDATSAGNQIMYLNISDAASSFHFSQNATSTGPNEYVHMTGEYVFKATTAGTVSYFTTISIQAPAAAYLGTGGYQSFMTAEDLGNLAP